MAFRQAGKQPSRGDLMTRSGHQHYCVVVSGFETDDGWAVLGEDLVAAEDEEGFVYPIFSMATRPILC